MQDFPYAGVRTVFLGTGDIALPALDWLAKNTELLAVVTQPDKPSGRGQKLAPGPVKSHCAAWRTPILQPKSLKDSEARNALSKFPAELFVVMAYGNILPKAVLDLPKIACLNLHASLLPKYRGASPVQAPLLAGDTETGITLMFMDEGLDTGDMLHKISIRLDPAETGGSLHQKLALLAPKVLEEGISGMLSGGLQRLPQNHSEATHTRKLRKEDGRIDWTRPACEIERKVRAFDPWPGTFCELPHGMLKNAEFLKINSVLPLTGESDQGGLPGVSVISAGKWKVYTGDGALEILEAQLPGKKRLTTGDLLRGLDLPEKFQLPTSA